MTKARPSRSRHRTTGWIPDQHGAWFMVIIPPLLAIIVGHPAWIHVPLLATWILGYFTFFAAGLWMRSRFKAKYRTPVLVYGSITALLGIITLVMDWQLIIWAIPYAPLVAIAVYETWHRRPRSLLSGEATVFAATLMFPVMMWAGTHDGFSGLARSTWVIFGILTAYYFGSIPYVKTLIRERGSRPWLAFSIGYHALILGAAIVFTLLGWVHWFAIVVAVALVFRSWWMPHSATKRGTPWKPREVGRLEIFLSLAMLVAAGLTLAL